MSEILKKEAKLREAKTAFIGILLITVATALMAYHFFPSKVTIYIVGGLMYALLSIIHHSLYGGKKTEKNS